MIILDYKGDGVKNGQTNDHTMMINDVPFLRDGWPTNSRKLYFQKRSSPEGLTIVSLQHAVVGIDPRSVKQIFVVLPLHHSVT